MKPEDLALDEWEDRRAEIERTRRQEQEDLRQVLDTGPGKRVLCRILAQCGLFRLSYTRNADTYFLEGQRQIGLWLFHEIVQALPERESLAWILRETKERNDARRTEDGSR